MENEHWLSSKKWEPGLNQKVMQRARLGSFPKKGDPNVDPKILQSLLWGPPQKVSQILGNPHLPYFEPPNPGGLGTAGTLWVGTARTLSGWELKEYKGLGFRVTLNPDTVRYSQKMRTTFFLTAGVGNNVRWRCGKTLRLNQAISTLTIRK